MVLKCPTNKHVIFARFISSRMTKHQMTKTDVYLMLSQQQQNMQFLTTSFHQGWPKTNGLFPFQIKNQNIK